MPKFEPQDADFGRRVRESFARQRIMQTLGATLTGVAPGEVEITLPFRDDLTQQHGFLHAGVVGTIADSAAGYAALSLMPPETGVLTIEYKINLLAPASGDQIIARGQVTKPGRTITVATADVFALQQGQEKLIATLQATIMTLRDRPGVSD